MLVCVFVCVQCMFVAAVDVCFFLFSSLIYLFIFYVFTKRSARESKPSPSGAWPVAALSLPHSLSLYLSLFPSLSISFSVADDAGIAAAVRAPLVVVVAFLLFAYGQSSVLFCTHTHSDLHMPCVCVCVSEPPIQSNFAVSFACVALAVSFLYPASNEKREKSGILVSTKRNKA